MQHERLLLCFSIDLILAYQAEFKIIHYFLKNPFKTYWASGAHEREDTHTAPSWGSSTSNQRLWQLQSRQPRGEKRQDFYEVSTTLKSSERHALPSLPSVCFRLVHMEYRSWCCNSSYSKPRIVFRMTAVLSISHFNAICCLSACAFLVLFLIKTLISLRKRSLLPSPTYPLYLTWYLKVLKKCLYNKGVAVYI